MMWNKSICILLLFLSGNVWANANDAVVQRVWVGESIPGQNSATLEMNITTVQKAKLVSLNSDAAEKVEIHSVAQHRGKMSTKVVKTLYLPAHHTTAFGTHQLFLILVGLKKELNIGDSIKVSGVIEYANHRRQSFEVDAPVKKMALSYKHLGSEPVHDHQ
jgi:copper(I)-binding protein